MDGGRMKCERWRGREKGREGEMTKEVEREGMERRREGIGEAEGQEGRRRGQERERGRDDKRW